MPASLSISNLSSPLLNEVDGIKLTKIWLDGSKRYKTASVRSPKKIQRIISLIRTTHRINDYACGPATPKYVIGLYNERQGGLVGEIRARANLVQINKDIGYVQSEEFVEVLESSLVRCKERSMGPVKK